MTDHTTTELLQPAEMLRRFELEEQERLRLILGRVIFILGITTLLGYLAIIPSQNPQLVFFVFSAMLAVELLAYGILRWGKVSWSALVLSAGLWAILFWAALFGEGITNVPFVALLILVVMVGLLLGRNAGLIVAVINSLAGLALLVLELRTELPPALIPVDLTGYWLSLTVISLGVAGLISIYTQSLREMTRRRVADVLRREEVAQELQTVRASLEEQVTRRTAELEQRTRYLQASIEVSRATASIMDTERLIQQAVDLIQKEFQLYYVGLFLVESAGEWAHLRAGTGEAGQAMIKRGHRIRVGRGMIGWSIANAESRVALDVGSDLVRLKTAELPNTQSEAAIPLRYRGRVLGALSVQSDQPQAFGQVEISAFEALADQLAIALANAQLFQEGQQALEQIQRAYGATSRQAWETLLRSRGAVEYTFENNLFLALPGGESTGDESAEMRQAILSGKSVTGQSSTDAMLLTPVKVRGEVIGVITFHKPLPATGVATWSREEIDLLEKLVDQLGVALDSARLYEDTQRQALRERLTSEATARFRETLDIETILRTAVQEVQRALGAPEVRVALRLAEQSDQQAPGMDEEPIIEEGTPPGNTQLANATPNSATVAASLTAGQG